ARCDRARISTAGSASTPRCSGPIRTHVTSGPGSPDALGPAGEDSLLLLLGRVDGSPAATGAVFFQPDVAGLYCFTTLERMRRRGLASALVHASHEAAQTRGIERAVLQATASGRPAYARAGYCEERSLPVFAL